MAKPNENGPTIHRLTDIETEEVSIVDRAANLRTFLVVKGANAMPTTPGAPVTPDGNGGHTATPPTPPAAPAMPSEPVLNLSPEAKAELIKRCDAAANRITALKTLIAGATEVPGTVEVPATISAMFAELLTGISHGEVEKGAPVAKGLPQFSTARVTQIQQARDALDALLGSITKPEAPATTPAPTEPDAGAVLDDAVTKAISKALASLELKLASGLDKITGVVAKHGEAIAIQNTKVTQIEKSSRPTPQSGMPEGEREGVNKNGDEDDDNGAWPTDMSNPDRHNVKTVDRDVRFTVD